MSTTRRINKSELEKIKQIQQILKNEGMDLSQAEISESLVDFTIQNINKFLNSLQSKHSAKDKSKPELRRLLFKPHTEGDSTNSVIDHDVTI
ncbi:MAG: hypothetical protein IH840_10715 [Candidatus Heimdallarchaeota archaeon]|nr:hypothetical protein [Candidatus Heimdallarchaeota archaeon]